MALNLSSADQFVVSMTPYSFETTMIRGQLTVGCRRLLQSVFPVECVGFVLRTIFACYFTRDYANVPPNLPSPLSRV